jgi:NADH-quinone oxidoreductase subunit G
VPQPGEIVEDALLIKADKNPNRTAALAMYPALPADAGAALTGADVVLVWGEGFPSALLPAGARCIRLDSYAHPDLSSADVFLPISVMTERDGHFTNFDGVVSPFTAAFAAKATVAHAATLFAQLAAPAGVTA